MGRPETDSLVRHYQRIEKTGLTSADYASALARVLSVSVSLLQGLENPDPQEYLQYVQELLKERLGTDENPALNGLLARHAERDKDNAFSYLTEDIAEHIEQVLLVRNPTMMADLIELTGLPESDLLAPANVRGFWFLSVKSRVLNCSEVLDGVSFLNTRVGEILREHLAGSGGEDSTVRMWHDNPWVRIEIHRPRFRDRMLVDLTRCQPDATGLRWIAPSWRDDFFLEPGIESHAYANADVVTDFSGRTTPADPRRLRLVVTEHEGSHGKALRRMVLNGGIDEMPDWIQEKFAKVSSTRILFMEWLTRDLRTALMPHLMTQSASAWQVRVNGGAIDICRKDPRFGSGSYAELRYRIMLAEETDSNVYDPVPVREKDFKELGQKVEEWLAAGEIPAADASERPYFEAV